MKGDRGDKWGKERAVKRGKQTERNLEKQKTYNLEEVVKGECRIKKASKKINISYSILYFTRFPSLLFITT